MVYNKIKFNTEKYNKFDIEVEKWRGEPYYDVRIQDTILQKVTRLEKFPANNKEELMKKIKPKLDQLIPQSQGWEKRKKELEGKYDIQSLTFSQGIYRLIYFYKGLKWKVEIRRSEISLKYKEYPYTGKLKKDVTYDEKARSKGYY